MAKINVERRDVISRLQEAGLTQNEAKVYNVLLQKGSTNGADISQLAGVDRTLTYSLLNKLIYKQLVEFRKKNKKRYFDITDPINLLNEVEEKKRKIESFISDLNLKTTSKINIKIKKVIK